MQQIPNQSLKNIPGPRSFPIVGNLPQLFPNPLPYIQRLHEQYGNIFYARFAFNRKSVFLLGPQLTEVVLMDRGQTFSNELGYEGLSTFLGKRGVLFQDGANHKFLRQTLNSAFRATALRTYLDTMNFNITLQVAKWVKQEGASDIVADIRQLTLNNASSTIAGARIRRDSADINKHFLSLLQAMASAFPSIPGTPKWRGLKGRRWLDNYFRTQIQKRRKSDSTDLFTRICHASVHSKLTTDDVTDNMIGMMAAAFETTASTITLILFVLAEHPYWQDRLRAELTPLLYTGKLNYEELSKCTETEWVFKEALRLYTPISYFPRRTTKDLILEGRNIPANTAITIAPMFVHQMATIYPDPQRFDPDRFSPERAEDKFHPCAWMPFGKGVHTCMGMHFARMETFAFLAQVLNAFKIEIIKGVPLKLNHLPVNRPVGKLPVRLSTLQQSGASKRVKS